MKFVRPSLFSILLLALITAGAIFFLPHIHNAKASGPVTWYIRPDGGTRYDSSAQPNGQCDGQADTAYPGTGIDQHCAFNDFRWLYDNQSYNNDAWVISGGDTVIVEGCASSSNNVAPNCRIGWPSANSRDTNGWYSWCYGSPGAYTCSNPPIPAGTPSQPTRILGGNYANCNNGNATDRSKLTQLYGGFGLLNVLNLTETQNVDVECLEITSHNGKCTLSGRPAYPKSCDRTQGELDDYDANGILTDNKTSNVLFQDLYIHGNGDAGIQGPIGGAITMDRVFIGFNRFAGWNFDDGNDTPDASGSSINANYVTMEGNGCTEQYPIVNTAFPAQACYDDSTDGFGDSWSGQDTELDSFTCNHCVQEYNTKDGFIGPHTDVKNLVIENSESIGNMGQQWKWDNTTNGSTIFENNLTIGNCERMSQQLPGAAQNFALSTGLPGSYLSDFCRAAGDVFSFSSQANSNVLIANNTVIGYSNTVFDMNCGPAGGGAGNCGTTPFIFKNNIFLGYTNINYNSSYPQAPGLFYASDSSDVVTSNNNIEYGIRNGDTCGTNGNICSDPLLTSEPSQTWSSELALDNFNFAPSASSPALAAGTPISGLVTDFNGTTRSNPPTIGAIEVAGSGSGGGSNPPPSDTTPPSTSITSPSNNATVSGNITIAASASDNVGVSSVALYIDGSPRATDASSPYSFSLDTTSLSNGSHTFVTKASDASGNVGTSGTITVTVSNVSGGGTSTSTPSSTPTGPSGYTFCSLEGTTCSFSGTESVAYGAGSSFNYLTLTNSTPCGNSIFTDPDSGVAKACFTKPSTPSSTPDTTPPTTSITAPISGGTLSGTASITASASDNVGITSVALVIDGSIQGTDNTAPYTFSLNTSNLSNGIHILATKAYDAAGNIGTSANVLVTVSNAVTPPPVSSGGGGGGGGGSNVVSTPSFNITSISISNLTPTTAQITITTNIPASVSLKYGLTTLYGNTTGVSPSLTTNYEKLTNLTPNTIYDFVVIATPPGGTQVISPVSTFKTLPMGGSTSSGGTGIAGSASSSISIGSSGSSLPAFTQNLAYGDTNSEVTLLQTILHTQGFLPGVLGITNYFGVQTEHALLLFQSAHDLNKSGFVDLQTQTLLNKIEAAQGNAGGVVSTPVQTSPSTPSGSLTRNLAPGSVGPDVMILQHLLNQDGDYPQAIYSTHYGSLTEAAVKLFQAKYGLVNYGAPNTTGYGAVGPKTRVKLGGI